MCLHTVILGALCFEKSFLLFMYTLVIYTLLLFKTYMLLLIINYMHNNRNKNVQHPIVYCLIAFTVKKWKWFPICKFIQYQLVWVLEWWSYIIEFVVWINSFKMFSLFVDSLFNHIITKGKICEFFIYIFYVWAVQIEGGGWGSALSVHEYR